MYCVDCCPRRSSPAGVALDGTLRGGKGRAGKEGKGMAGKGREGTGGDLPGKLAQETDTSFSKQERWRRNIVNNKSKRNTVVVEEEPLRSNDYEWCEMRAAEDTSASG